MEKETPREITTDDGATLRYRLWRPGRHRKLLVLVHGMASNMTRWSEFVEHTRLKDDWDILRLDLRGHGESLYRGRLSMKQWGRDLSDILDTERYQDAVIVGHSLGAQAALHFAHDYPSRVKGLVLVDPVFHEALPARLRLMYHLRGLIWVLVMAVRLLNMIGMRRRHIPNRDLRQLDRLTRERFLDTGRHEEMIANYSSPWPDLKHFPTANYLQELIMTISPVPPVAEIKVPVLALLASAPTFTDLDTTKTVIRRFPRSTIVDIHAYHWPLTERPDETREAIEAWCREHF